MHLNDRAPRLVMAYEHIPAQFVAVVIDNSARHAHVLTLGSPVHLQRLAGLQVRVRLVDRRRGGPHVLDHRPFLDHAAAGIGAVKTELYRVVTGVNRRFDQQVVRRVVQEAEIEIGRVDGRVHAGAFTRVVVTDLIAVRVAFKNGEAGVKRSLKGRRAYLTHAATYTVDGAPADDHL